ncbi:glycosyltransferase family 2 protein [Alistipes sp.]|uniref:glycosyltransferase family 2 protein n=1 Tax=Alistipes sp. TaxID=1872444 RepID=UPI003AF00D91
MLDITVVILTYNEQLHISRCLENIQLLAKKIYVIDCYSTDDTATIARQYGAEVFLHAWPGNQADQLNWALDTLPFETSWVLRMDADEYLTQDLIAEIEQKVPELNQDISAIVLPLKRVFMGRHIKHGTGAISMIRLFRHGTTRCERRWMDEHMLVEFGCTITFENPFVDDNLNTIGYFTAKHNGYSIREAVELLDIELNILPKNQKMGALCPEVTEKRAKKAKYAKMPLFWRPFVYFGLRYFVRGGFLDGKEGFLWHFLQGWWYRTLVDAKIYEIKKACGKDREAIKRYLKEKYQIVL